MINYEINKEYMDWLISKLDSANLNNKPDESISGYRLPNIIDQIGITAKHYLDNKNRINEDPGNLPDVP